MNPACYELANAQVAIAGSRLRAPRITYDVQKKVWRLEEDYSCPHRGSTITVPQGFEFDLASVPRVFWPLISPFDLSIAGPLIHDFLYRHGGKPPAGSIVPLREYTRRETDAVFRDIMREEGVAGWRRVAAYWAVRIFGRKAWKG